MPLTLSSVAADSSETRIRRARSVADQHQDLVGRQREAVALAQVGVEAADDRRVGAEHAPPGAPAPAASAARRPGRAAPAPGSAAVLDVCLHRQLS